MPALHKTKNVTIVALVAILNGCAGGRAGGARRRF
jgi:hypothetical protein